MVSVIKVTFTTNISQNSLMFSLEVLIFINSFRNL